MKEKMKAKIVHVWTSIAVREDTHTRLKEKKQLKSPGNLENFDDVIRRHIDAPPVKGDEE